MDIFSRNGGWYMSCHVKGKVLVSNTQRNRVNLHDVMNREGGNCQPILMYGHDLCDYSTR